MSDLAIACVPAGNPGPYTGPAGNNTWLVDGREPLLVDAGVGANAHLAALEEKLAGRPLARVFITHGHPDHASGLPALAARWPGLEAIVGGGTSSTRIAAGDDYLEIIPTPGHSPDHACLWHAPSRAVFGGDLLVMGGTVMIAASSGGSLRDYLASLARVRALAPRRAYPGHGPVIDDPIALIDEYVAHRQARDAQVRGALEGGVGSVDALVATIYPDLDPALGGAARETVLAHLHKLADEGAAIERDGEWRAAGTWKR